MTEIFEPDDAVEFTEQERFVNGACIGQVVRLWWEIGRVVCNFHGCTIYCRPFEIRKL